MTFERKTQQHYNTYLNKEKHKIMTSENDAFEVSTFSHEIFFFVAKHLCENYNNDCYKTIFYIIMCRMVIYFV